MPPPIRANASTQRGCLATEPSLHCALRMSVVGNLPGNHEVSNQSHHIQTNQTRLKYDHIFLFLIFLSLGATTSSQNQSLGPLKVCFFAVRDVLGHRISP